MVEITLPIVLQILQTAGILVGIVYYITIMRNSQRNQELTLKAQEQAVETRQAQLFMQLYNAYLTKDFLADFARVSYIFQYENLEDWMKKYSSFVNLADYSTWARIGRFLDGAGILVKKNLIDMNLVDELLREPILYSWENMKKWVYEIREEMKTPEVWANFEYLYNEVRKRHPKTTSFDDLPSTRVVPRPEN